MANNPNISILPHNDCCGCRACGDVCPVSCISFNKDNEGFLYPCVNNDTCIHCGKCTKTCPELKQDFNNVPDNVMAAFALSNTARQAGSSGGLFGLIAESVINKGGKVWGAAFDDNLQLRHICATTIVGLEPLLRSKYLQSDTSGCFKQIAKDLKNGTLTLFCGTPCQCNALRNYVGENRNLYLIDLICHGVPSQDLFDKSIAWFEKKNKCKVNRFIFRSKYKGALHPQAFTCQCSVNGKQKNVNGLHYQFPFYFGFQKYITLRPSCYTCKWARSERSGDITLGDFWGIDKLEPSLDPKQGLSEVLVNTQKGHELMRDIIDVEKVWTKEFTFNQVAGENGCLHGPTKMKPERAELFRDLQTMSFDDIVKAHFVSKRQWIFDLYYGMPGFLRKIIRKVMDKRMKYE
ncbi:MAG: Coenzyme F420 hydrogenase/dehydrogenase, beta subunit C-terminal domain [Muribaculaceae bacterium]|nr:Coenzyme F420 hydrogenase/dehydrogenase, beta subunit C-terminal domain [Muribaculaceae bacterium]